MHRGCFRGQELDDDWFSQLALERGQHDIQRRRIVVVTIEKSPLPIGTRIEILLCHRLGRHDDREQPNYTRD